MSDFVRVKMEDADEGLLREPLIVAEAEEVDSINQEIEDDKKNEKPGPSSSSIGSLELEPNRDDTRNKDESDSAQEEFAVGTRGEVEGAAAVFFTAGFLLVGPFVGVATAAIGGHVAANKEGRMGNFVRHCGSLLDNIGKTKDDKRKKNGTQQDQQSETSQAIVVASPHGHRKKQGLWSKITEELVHGAEWIEARLFSNHQYNQVDASSTDARHSATK